MKRHGLWLLLLAWGMAGCLGGSRPVPLIKHYVLEYPPPRSSEPSAPSASLRVSRFSAVRIYAGSEMLIRQGPYLQEVYQGQRWRVSPADLVTDLLRRDLREARLFQAVLTARDREEARFQLEGGVESFQEIWTASGGRKATLTLTLTLLDLSHRAFPERLVFQKTYRSEASCTRKGAEGLAEAMSRAMGRCSVRIMADIAAALRRR